MTEKAYTTFQISKFCNVNHRTVLTWIKKNKLKAFKTPGGHSRIRESDLLAFFEEFSIPIPDELKQAKSHVLIVDDEENILNLIEDAIKSISDLQDKVVITKCTNGIDALMMIGKEQPNLVFLDICMPYLDGYEVCKRVRSNPDTKDIEIIAISGKLIPEAEHKIIAAGADDFIAKPFTIETLQSKVREVLLP